MALRCSEQLKNTITSSKLKNDNQGFSLVEVLIAVFVLAIVFTPVMKSFMVASLTNSRAQSTQNATSLAETIMEEVKGNSIEDLYKSSLAGAANKPKFLDNGGSISFKCGTTPEPPTSFATAAPPYIIEYTGVTATQGQTYNATVTIDADEYAKSGAEFVTSGGVSDINTWKAPELSKVNDLDNAVISWEINKFDKVAVDQLVYKNAKNDADPAADRVNIINDLKNHGGKKTINIEIDKSGDSIAVTCNVDYSFVGSTYSGNVSHVVYTGFLKKADTNTDTIGSVYIFYNTCEEIIDAAGSEFEGLKGCFKNENIVINETSTAKDSKLNCGHDIYLIKQKNLKDSYKADNSGDLKAGEVVSLPNTCTVTNKYDGVEDASLNTGDYPRKSAVSKRTFYSNVPNAGASAGINELYAKNDKNRVYKVTVILKKSGSDDVSAQLVSTIQSGSEAQ